jgi:hypothetical protein
LSWFQITGSQTFLFVDTTLKIFAAWQEENVELRCHRKFQKVSQCHQNSVGLSCFVMKIPKIPKFCAENGDEMISPLEFENSQAFLPLYDCRTGKLSCHASTSTRDKVYVITHNRQIIKPSSMKNKAKQN